MNLKNIFKNTLVESIQQIDEEFMLKILKIRNEKNVRLNMINQEVIPVDTHLNWFRKQLDDNTKKLFSINHELKLRGLISLDLKKISWAFYISNDSLRGLGAVAEYIFLNKLFANLKFEKVFCEVFVYNTSVLKLHKKFGFKEISSKKIYVKVLKKDCELIKLELNKNVWIKVEKEMSVKFR